MKVQLMGVKKLDFTPKGERNAIVGTYIFVAYKSVGVEGLECMKKFISDELADEVLGIDLVEFIGKEIDIELGFNSTIVAISA